MNDHNPTEKPETDLQKLVQELKNYQDAIQVHQHVEKKAQESDLIFRLILENISETVYLVDKDGNFLFIPKSDKVLGFSWEETKKMGNIFKLISNNFFNPDSFDFDQEINQIETKSISKLGKTVILKITIRKTEFRRGAILIICTKISESDD